MSEKTKNRVILAVASVAVVVIAFGALNNPALPPTAEERVASLSASIKCPFCNGESLAESASGVAADYRALIADRVENGATDDEIRGEFAERFGEAYVLDGSRSGWTIALWVVLGVAVLSGAAAILMLRRATGRGEVAEPQDGVEDRRGARISGRTLAGTAAVGVAIIAIGVVAATSLSSGGTDALEGVAGDVVAGNEVDLDAITNEQMEEVVAANPEVIGMRLALARRYFEAGEFGKALDHYFEVLDRERHPEALANVGWMTYLSGEPEVAVQYLEAALARSPDYLPAKWFISNVLVDLGRPLEAEPYLIEVMASPDAPDEIKLSAATLLQQIQDEK